MAYVWAAVVGVGCALLSNALIVIAWARTSWQPGLLSSGWGGFLAAALVLVLAALGLVVSVVGLAVRRVRQIVSLVAVSCAVTLAVGYGLMAAGVSREIGWSIRRSQFCRLADRSRPLVEAIERYAEEHGQPPPDLQALVPEFLDRVPQTGLWDCPEYGYQRLAGVRPVSDEEPLHAGNPWILVLDLPMGRDVDQFLYYPLQNYPERAAYGPLEPMCTWGYVHD
ncbi:MAG: hypothetical protein FJZ90_18550 [Chloroflexi bacterium]|nr:hypothetical protein [Chloroflexota bacterium]